MDLIKKKSLLKPIEIIFTLIIILLIVSAFVFIYVNNSSECHRCDTTLIKPPKW